MQVGSVVKSWLPLILILVFCTLFLRVESVDALPIQIARSVTHRLDIRTVSKLADAGKRYQELDDNSVETSFPLRIKGKNSEIRVFAHDIRSKGYKALVTTDAGTVEDPFQVQLFTGSVDTNAANFARLALITNKKTGDTSLDGFLSIDGVMYNVSSLAQSVQTTQFDLSVTELSPETLKDLVASCVIAGVAPQDALALDQSAPPIETANSLRVAEIATEADYEMTQSLGSDANANARILSILNGVDAIYRAQLGVTLQVTFQHAWATVNDPYTTDDAVALLTQFGNYWEANYAAAQRYDVAHLWTGRDTYVLSNGVAYYSVIGIAWISAVCRSGYKYGLSEHSLSASIQAYSVPLVAHEVGHNFGAQHDTCDPNNPTATPWIMCPFLVSNATIFSSTSVSAVSAFLPTATCLSATNTYAISGAVTAGAAVTINTGGTCTVSGTVYVCADIAQGASATVTPSRIGYTFTPASRSYTNIAQNYTAQDFAGTLTYHSITGSINAGATISITGGGSCSVAGTSYTCSAIPYGSTVTITPALTGYTFSPASRTFTSMTQNFTAQDFVGTINTYSITGVVTTGATVSIVGGGSCSASGGSYACSGVPYGSTVTVTPTLVGYSFTPPFRSYASITGALTGQDFVGVANTFSISGSVPTGTTLGIVGGGSCAVGNGFYTCSAIAPGSTVTITPSHPGYTFTPASRTHSNVVQNLTGQNFTAAMNTYSIAGSMTPSGTLSIVGGGSCSVSYSLYNCSGIPYNSTVRITPTLLGYNYVPLSRTFANVTQNLTGQNFVAKLADPVVGEGPLLSPLYALWNGFLGMNNVLELFNTGDSAFTVTLAMYDILGTQVDTRIIPLPGHTKQDIIVNNLKGFHPDSYGLMKLTFPGTALNGGMYIYKPNTYSAAPAGDDYDFSFAVPFENNLHGPTYVGFNTFHPSTNPLDSGGSVYNWLSIVNLDPVASHSFTVTRYDRNGQLLSTKTLRIPRLGRRDVDGGHGEGRQVVGLNKITPENNNILYKAELIRYGTPGNNSSSYSFAFPLLPTAPGGPEQWVSISSGAQGQNWIEVINTLNAKVSAALVFYDNAGHVVFQDNQRLTLSPHQQKHFNASAVLPPGFSGAARIRFNKPGALVSQSMFYFFDASGSVTAMYGVPGTKSNTGTLAGSWNLRLNMYNWLRVFNTSAQSQTMTLRVYNGNVSATKRYTLSPFHGTDLPLHDTATFKTATNSSGVLTVSGNSLQAQLLRFKPTVTGGIDYIEETPVSAR